MRVMCSESSAPVDVPTELPRENVFGHSKKLALILGSLQRLRAERARTLQILDVGCGNGEAVTRFLGMRSDHVLGIDIHKKSIEYAQRVLGTERLKFRVAQIADLAEDASRYDAVVLSDVLEHVLNPSELLIAARGLLRPGGLILLSVPNGRGPFEIESAVSRIPVLGGGLLTAIDHLVAFFNRYVWRDAWVPVASQEAPYNLDSGHVQFFTRRSLDGLIAQSGLLVCARRNVSWLSGPFTNYLFAPWVTFCLWNTRVADRLPPSIVSAWYLELTPAGSAQRQ
jgi:SAM-dependent methyltransferase